MKNWILLLGLLIGVNSFAQEKKIDKINERPLISADTLKFEAKTNTMEFQGNVSFKTDIIELENADKIVMNKTTNEIIVTGLRDIIKFDGALHIKGENEKKILKYTIGERIAYLE